MSTVNAWPGTHDVDVVRVELRSLQESVPIVFGGEVQQEKLRITELFGTQTSGLRGLVVPTRSGLGGRVLHRQRPAVIEDYEQCKSITHDFDEPVLGEGISSVLAVPVVVAGACRAVLYGATRGTHTLGSRALGAVTSAAQRIATELSVRDEVAHRVRCADAPATPVNDPERAAVQNLRDVHAQLRQIAARTTDVNTRSDLQALCSALIINGRHGSDIENDATALSPREVDVLALVAIGYTNPQTARHLGVLPETVKSYLRSVNVKLQVHSRLEAVVAARRLGLLP